jgi:hypothetical protein
MPSYRREQLGPLRDMIRQEAVGIAQIAKKTGLTRQTVCGGEGALAAWRL